MAHARAYLAMTTISVILITGLVVVLSERSPRRTGVNGIPPSVFVDSLREHQTACQTTSVPAQTRSIGFSVGAYHASTPPLLLSLTLGAEQIARAYAKGGYLGGELRISVSPIKKAISGASLCLENLGPARVALAGIDTAGDNSTLDGQGRPAALNISFYGATTSGWGLAPILARRVGLFDFGGTGSWLLWMLVAVMIIASVGAICLITREIGR